MQIQPHEKEHEIVPELEEHEVRHLAGRLRCAIGGLKFKNQRKENKSSG